MSDEDFATRFLIPLYGIRKHFHAKATAKATSGEKSFSKVKLTQVSTEVVQFGPFASREEELDALADVPIYNDFPIPSWAVPYLSTQHHQEIEEKRINN